MLIDDDPLSPPQSDLFIVGIGASAGGLEAFTNLIKRLPVGSNMAVVLVQHLDPHHASALTEILSAQTPIPVVEVENGVKLESGRIFVIPPNMLMRVEGDSLVLEERPSGHERFHPVDVLFKSMADVFGGNAIGVVLSGAATDGTLGLENIKAAGGITFAQNQTAKFDSMPQSAIASGVVDFILSPARIAEELIAITRPSQRSGRDAPGWLGDGSLLQRLLVTLRQQTGVDFTQYKQPTILRRITRRLTVRKCESLADYLQLVRSEPAEVQALFDDLLINVTDFFRDPEVFEAAKNKAFRLLLGEPKRRRTIRVWIPACSSGEEVYSMAISLAEFLESEDLDWPVQIFGTDVSESAIAKARLGTYREDAVGKVSPERLRRFFVQTGSLYQISRTIREMCIFSRHNVANDPPLSRMDLVSCRNVLIYFSQTLQRRIIKTFAYALAPNGLLILGSSETLSGMRDYFETLDEPNRIYRRTATSAPINLDASMDYTRQTGFSSAQRFEKPIALQATQTPPMEGDRPNQDSNLPAVGLEQELLSTREYLQSVIEELRSSNEEAQSANEELQSTNEELQTSKEELQSSNEELHTVNAEMQSRNAELAQSNDDLTNLLSSMNMPIIMTGSDLRIRRYTSATERVLRVIDTDVGRPIADLKPRINISNLEEVLERVSDTLEPFEQEVQDNEGHSYLMRVRPYRTLDNRIDGTVVQLLDVTELKKSLDEARSARAYAEAIFNTVREPLAILDQDLAVTNANWAFYRWLGLSQEALGRSVYDVARGQFSHPDVCNLLNQVAASSAQAADAEIAFQTDAGDSRTLLVSARRLPNPGQKLILMAFEDLTERKRAAEARYRRLFESAWDGILLVDAATGEILDLNPFMERLFGYTRTELMGRKVWYAGPFRNLPTARVTVEQVRDKGMIRFNELMLAARDGRDVQTEVIANVYQEVERRVIQFNIRDVTERRRFDLKLQETQKLEGLGLLAGGIAHDFNNLLTGILGNASLAFAELPGDDPNRVYIREVINAGERAAFLTRQMLAYAGKGRFVVETIDFNNLVSEISQLVRASIPKNVELKMDLGADLPPFECDPAQLQQVVMNLVINGAEAIGEKPAGKVEVCTCLRRLSAAEDEEFFGRGHRVADVYLQLEVIDNGAGMNEETKARIFDPFFSTKFTGRGLGLAAVQGIIKRHEGALRVYSTPGHGTTFLILFPAVEMRGPAVRDQSVPQSPGIPTGSVALIVDDENIVRRVAREVLGRRGMKILTADNGQEAVEIFRSHHNLISVVILDLTMPVMSGEEALRQMKEINAEVPVILSSGYQESEAAQRFGLLKPAAFLQKPYTTERLISSVASVLSQLTNSEPLPQ